MENRRQLGGGYINQVFLTSSGHIEKPFHDELLTGIPAAQRMKRESLALARFGGTIAPALLSLAVVTVYQEFVQGKTYRDIMNEDPNNTACARSAGNLLRQIHVPVTRPFAYLKEEIEAKIKKYTKLAEPVISHFLPKPVPIQINWEEVQKFGSTRVHRDFWYGNIINGKAIDWEYSGIGSPFEDFAIAELWIFMQYGGKGEFYHEYGRVPDDDTIRNFLNLRCHQFLSTATVDIINEEDPTGEMFYHNILNVLNGGVYENRK